MTCQYLAYSIFHRLISSAVSLIALSPLFLSISFLSFFPPALHLLQILVNCSPRQLSVRPSLRLMRRGTEPRPYTLFSPAIPRLPSTFIILTWGRGPLGQWQMIMPTNLELRLIDVRACVCVRAHGFIHKKPLLQPTLRSLIHANRLVMFFIRQIHTFNYQLNWIHPPRYYLNYLFFCVR